MSSASPGSATRFRMKLLSRACAPPTASEMRSSCLAAIIHCLLRASSICTCRRWSEENILGKLPRPIVDARPSSEIRPEFEASKNPVVSGENGSLRHAERRFEGDATEASFPTISLPVGQGPVSLRVARAVGAANFLHSDQPPDAVEAQA